MRRMRMEILSEKLSTCLILKSWRSIKNFEVQIQCFYDIYIVGVLAIGF